MCEFTDKVDAAMEAVSGITPSQADDLRQSGAVVFVDPRPRDAIRNTTGMIPGAYQVSLEALEQGELPAELSDREKTVVTSCQAGPMGAIAAHALQKRGFTRVSYVAGGTQAWLDAGLPTDR